MPRQPLTSQSELTEGGVSHQGGWDNEAYFFYVEQLPTSAYAPTLVAGPG